MVGFDARQLAARNEGDNLLSKSFQLGSFDTLGIPLEGLYGQVERGELIRRQCKQITQGSGLELPTFSAVLIETAFGIRKLQFERV
jgi:hypothetical protein